MITQDIIRDILKRTNFVVPEAVTIIGKYDDKLAKALNVMLTEPVLANAAASRYHSLGLNVLMFLAHTVMRRHYPSYERSNNGVTLGQAISIIACLDHNTVEALYHPFFSKDMGPTVNLDFSRELNRPIGSIKEMLSNG